MIISVHIISGGVTGELLGNPVLAFWAGIILHFILDAIPHFDNFLDEECHWNRKQTISTSLDILLSIGLLIFLRPALTINNAFWWGAFGGVLPDLIDNIPIIRDYLLHNKIVQKYHAFHEATHIIKKPGLIFGFSTQIATIAIFVALHFVLK